MGAVMSQRYLDFIQRIAGYVVFVTLVLTGHPIFAFLVLLVI